MTHSPAASGDGEQPPLGARLGLSARERAVLDLERRHWAVSVPPAPGIKECEIREVLGISPARYYQLLNGLLDREAALAYLPVMISRLRAVREIHRASRQ